MKMRRNYEVKHSIARAFDISLLIPDKTFNQRDITIDLSVYRKSSWPAWHLVDKRNLRARSYMPLIKSTIFKPHGTIACPRWYLRIPCGNYGVEYREHIIDRIMQTHCLLQSARCVGFQIYSINFKIRSLLSILQFIKLLFYQAFTTDLLNGPI